MFELQLSSNLLDFILAMVIMWLGVAGVLLAVCLVNKLLLKND